MDNQEIQEAIEAKKVEIQDLVAQSEQALEEGNLELSKELLDKAKSLQAEIDELQAQLTEDEEVVENRLEEDEQPSDDKDKEDIKAQLEDLKTKNDKNGEKRNMTNVVETVVVADNKNEVRSAFGTYIAEGTVSAELREAGLVTTSNAVIVPQEVAKEVMDVTEDVSALANLVTAKKVNTQAGEIAFFDGTQAPALASTEELAKNPNLTVQAIKKADYKVDTYRGALPISKEAIEDGIGAVELVKDLLREAKIATENKEILAVLSKKEAVAVKSLDELKKVLNVTLAPKFKKQVVVSQSVFNWLDTLKDGNQRYLLQDSISAQSGKQILGLPVAVFEDALIGADTMYIGDLKSSVALVQRSEYEAHWVANDIYGEVLMLATRLDVVELNKNASVKVTVAEAKSLEL